ncbi:MAG: U32 family peptidase [Thermodesulfobacteriota bacterium]|nr:U32 family peptidase [Thermodesulfobacteriota bacterium]
MEETIKPGILAPAGDKASFLAAVAAGADAVYCGLKIFSARMEADNFSMEELSQLTAFARSKKVAVYVALNSLIKQNELEKTARILTKLVRYVNPHGLIVQDMAVPAIVRKAGFNGQIHLSTLGSASFPAGLETIKTAGFDRVVLPREFTIDEIRTMAENKPSGLDLEVFVHGALCYAVSGRCYWSSWFGGKSGLRGRCVQPCRRMYTQGREKQRFFSCLDFSVDVLVKLLLQIPGITTWKIEGRKKSPHYVFYTVQAYKLLRDHGTDPVKKKTALAFLEYALGRPATHYNFLSHRMHSPLQKDTETGSGLFAGRVKFEKKPFFITREPLLKGDLLRIGYEDGKGHDVQLVNRSIPKKGKLVLRQGRYNRLQKGAPVFIVDRKETSVYDLIQGLSDALETIPRPLIKPAAPGFDCLFKGKKKKKRQTRGPDVMDITLYRAPVKEKRPGQKALWLCLDSLKRVPAKHVKTVMWWLPPVIWPNEEKHFSKLVKKVLSEGAVSFVLNMSWQLAFFKGMTHAELWAGPFCNTANSAAVHVLKKIGFSGVIVSPELDRDNFLTLPENASLPIGVIIQGNFPLAISRQVSEDLNQDRVFSSPMKENAWVSQTDGNYWVFPDWILDFNEKRGEMIRAGFVRFITINETVPKGIEMKKRQGLWNWELRLL